MADKELMVISGIGYISAEGTGVKTFYSQVNNNTFNAEMTNYDPQGYLGKGTKYLSKAAIMYSNLAYQCIEQNNLHNIIKENPDTLGLYNSSELPSLEEVFHFDLDTKIDGPSFVSPLSIPNTLLNVSSSMMAIKAKITGINYTLCAGSSSTLIALNIASLHLANKSINYALVVSTEVSSKYHKALRSGIEQKADYKNSLENGISVTLESAGNRSDKDIHCKILEVTSGQTSKNESKEALIIRLIKDLLNFPRLKGIQLDCLIIGGGVNNINPLYLISLVKQSISDSIAVAFPEIIYGIGENVGGLSGLLYGIGLFNNQISNFNVNAENQDINNILLKDKIYNNIIICTIDKSGNGAVVLISK